MTIAQNNLATCAAANGTDTAYQVLAETPIAIDANFFAEFGAYFEAISFLFESALGDSAWLNLDQEDSELASSFLITLLEALSAESENGSLLSESERASLDALPLPEFLAVEKRKALMDRLEEMANDTLELSSEELAEIQAASFLLKDTMDTLVARNADISKEALDRTFEEASSRLNEGIGSEDIVQKPLFYKLTNIDSQFIRRGQLSDLGVIDGIILAPNTLYELAYLEPDTLRFAITVFKSGSNGSRTRLPPSRLVGDLSVDSDADGLSDQAEDILGTNPNNPDSDDDGVKDGAEIAQGTNPLDGRTSTTGVVATGPVEGNAVDVCTVNDLAVLALKDEGIAIFNIFNGLSPVLVSQLQTAGEALALSCEGRFVAVADGSEGVAVIDISRPSSPVLLHQIDFERSITSVTAVNGIVYAASIFAGEIHAIDLRSGVILGTVLTGSAAADRVHDVVRRGNHLWVLTSDHLMKYELVNHLPEFLLKSPKLSFFAEGLTDRSRLSIADGRAYATSYPGYDVLDITVEESIPIIGTATEHGPNSFKQILPDGGNLGVAAVGVNPRLNSTHDLSLYDISDPAVTSNLVTTLLTPGFVYAAALYKGYVYVADGPEGLQVINYRLADTGDVGPTISLDDSLLENPTMEENQSTTLVVEVSDDVAVRSVELYIDGELVSLDGSYPFEFDFLNPSRSEGRTEIIIQARATDTGGNSVWTDELTVELLDDATPPILLGVSPIADTTVFDRVTGISAVFNEALSPDPLDSDLQVISAGFDGALDTEDDVLISGNVYLQSVNGILLDLGEDVLSNGLYRGVLAGGISDLKGNQTVEGFTWEFMVDDLVPPNRISEDPADGAQNAGAGLQEITATFDEKMLFAGEGLDSLGLRGQGPDCHFNTPDDTILSPVEVLLESNEKTVRFVFAEALPPDHYIATIGDSLTDLVGNPSTEPRSWEFVIPYRTNLAGTVRFADGSPASGVVIRTHDCLEPHGISNADGSILIPNAEFAAYEMPDIDFHVESDGKFYLGRRLSVELAAGGVTDLGDIVLQELCPEELVDFAGFEEETIGRFKKFIKFDPGTGEAVFALGTRPIPSTGNHFRDEGLYKWENGTWVKIDGVFDANFNPELRAMAVHDDGSGPALYVGGYFASVNGIQAENIVRWDGENWEAVGSGLALSGDQPWGVHSLAVFDDGNGPELYAGGHRLEGIDGLAKWDGSEWSSVTGLIAQSGFDIRVSDLVTHDDGSGEALYLGGEFLFEGTLGAGATDGNLAKFKEGAFTALGGGLSWSESNTSVSLTQIEPFGTSLFVTGSFDTAGSVTVSGFAEWNGVEWSAVGNEPDRYQSGVRKLAAIGDDVGPALLVYGFTSDGLESLEVSRWNGTAWSRLNGPDDSDTDLQGGFETVVPINSGETKELLFGGSFAPKDSLGRMNGRSSIIWDGDSWVPTEKAFDGEITKILAAPKDEGIEVFVAGEFTSVGGQRLNGFARFDGERFTTLGPGFEANSIVNDMIFYDDGAGGALYVAGVFTPKGSETHLTLGKWNGTDWERPGGVEFLAPGNVPSAPLVLEVFNGGEGDELFVGGSFRRIKEGETFTDLYALVSWNGSDWKERPVPVSGPFPAVWDLHALKDGSTPKLYIGGNSVVPDSFGFTRGLWVWDGESFELPEGFSEQLDTLWIDRIGSIKTANGVELYVAGPIGKRGEDIRYNVARQRNGNWDLLELPEGYTFGGTAGSYFNEYFKEVIGYDDGFGPAIYVQVSITGQEQLGLQNSSWVRWSESGVEILEATGISTFFDLGGNFEPVEIGGSPSLLRVSTEGLGTYQLLQWLRSPGPCE